MTSKESFKDIRGISFIEFLVIIIILGMLAAIIIPTITKANKFNETIKKNNEQFNLIAPMDNIAAFPKANSNQEGMTLRDYFAAHAMQGLSTYHASIREGSNEYLKVAEEAVRRADALLVELGYVGDNVDE